MNVISGPTATVSSSLKELTTFDRFGRKLPSSSAMPPRPVPTSSDYPRPTRPGLGGPHHHGGGHHHGGSWRGSYGGGYPGGGRWDWGPYWASQPEVIVVAPPACSNVWRPVMASDGKIYRNECFAQQAGATALRPATGKELQTTQPLSGVGSDIGKWLLGWTAVLSAAAATVYGTYKLNKLISKHDRR